MTSKICEIQQISITSLVHFSNQFCYELQIKPYVGSSYSIIRSYSDFLKFQSQFNEELASILVKIPPKSTFMTQQKLSSRIPLLVEFLNSANIHSRGHNLDMHFFEVWDHDLERNPEFRNAKIAAPDYNWVFEDKVEVKQTTKKTSSHSLNGPRPLPNLHVDTNRSRSNSFKDSELPATPKNSEANQLYMAMNRKQSMTPINDATNSRTPDQSRTPVTPTSLFSDDHAHVFQRKQSNHSLASQKTTGSVNFSTSNQQDSKKGFKSFIKRLFGVEQENKQQLPQSNQIRTRNQSLDGSAFRNTQIHPPLPTSVPSRKLSLHNAPPSKKAFFVTIVACCLDGRQAAIRISRNVSFRAVEVKVLDKFEVDFVELKYYGYNGIKCSISNENDWRKCIDQCVGDSLVIVIE